MNRAYTRAAWLSCAPAFLVYALMYGLAAPAPLRAQEQPRPLMAEPTAYTDVLDAFDDEDLLDVSVSLTFHRLLQSGNIQREVVDARTIDGRSTRAFIDVAEHERTRNELGLSLAVGLYHDLMLYARMPVILGEDRELMLPEGTRCGGGDSDPEVCSALVEPDPGDADRVLFDATASSAKRSGIPHIDLGVAWSPINQHRGSSFATWTLRVETTIATGEVMKPCIAGDCAQGVSRGTGALGFESRWSYRVRYFEPYLGIGHRLEWATTADDSFTPAGGLLGDVDPAPPSVTTSTVGIAIIPWEDRGRHQRFAVDVRANAAMISEGRDYSPLFDALGSSRSLYLTQPNYDRLASSARDAVEVPFTGLTHVQAHARIGLAAALVMQAARYVRFTLGVRSEYLTPHLLTGEPACNTAVDPMPGDPRIGDCARGILNPSYRPVIDAPGQRFRLDSDLLFDLFVTAMGRF